MVGPTTHYHIFIAGSRSAPPLLLPPAAPIFSFLRPSQIHPRAPPRSIPAPLPPSPSSCILDGGRELRPRSAGGGHGELCLRARPRRRRPAGRRTSSSRRATAAVLALACLQRRRRSSSAGHLLSLLSASTGALLPRRRRSSLPFLRRRRSSLPRRRMQAPPHAPSFPLLSSHAPHGPPSLSLAGGSTQRSAAPRRPRPPPPSLSHAPLSLPSPARGRAGRCDARGPGRGGVCGRSQVRGARPVPTSRGHLRWRAAGPCLRQPLRGGAPLRQTGLRSLPAVVQWPARTVCGRGPLRQPGAATLDPVRTTVNRRWYEGGGAPLRQPGAASAAAGLRGGRSTSSPNRRPLLAAGAGRIWRLLVVDGR
ncbi:hypothetical protein PVAP13_1NG276257 [Panicum virgatum]|uniref:Uncharacterized protein n=1 Tax=Panicum virgatum TaxID=38727 RepID=A0A8T0X082_PANVG|nr:hypothetical protein PVAP13_1NG276257 [Panicum virgatum]